MAITGLDRARLADPCQHGRGGGGSLCGGQAGPGWFGGNVGRGSRVRRHVAHVV